MAMVEKQVVAEGPDDVPRGQESAAEGKIVLMLARTIMCQMAGWCH